METEFVKPNLHIILIHYPLALLVAGTLIELFSFMWRRSGFRTAGRWMILLGALSAVPTALSGVYALRDVANPEGADMTWKDVAAQNVLNARQWEVLRDHVILSSVATGLAVLVVVTWLGSSDLWRRRLHWPLLALLLASVGLIAAGAHHGGEAVYGLSTGVAHASSDAEPTTEPTASTATMASTGSTGTSASPAANGIRGFTQQVPRFLPPMQMHVILAGVATAIGLASLGLSFRKAFQLNPATQVDHIAAAFGSGAGPDEPVDESETREILREAMPVSRFWMLACLVALLTVATGYWLLVIGFEMRSVTELWKAAIVDNKRRLAHLIAGGAIVVLPVVLAGVSRWSPRQKWLLGPLALLLLLAIAFQVWVGILLMFDSPEGSVTRFN